MKALTTREKLTKAIRTVDTSRAESMERRPILMRTMIAMAFACLAWASATAQADNSNLRDLPGWMYTELTGQPAPKAAKSSAKPLHTNAFIGTWTLRDKQGRRIHYWGDQHRMVFREMRDSTSTTRITVVDLAANVKLKVSPSPGITHITIDDLKLAQVGYFYKLFNDTVIATRRTEQVMGQTCNVLKGGNSNKDTATYYRTTVHPKLFADLKAWSVYLCREGNLEFLSAFSDKKVGSSLRVTWRDVGYTNTDGDWWFERITPGKQPMPALPWRPNRITEERFLYTNNARLGRLPDWMRERINRLPPIPELVQSTPPVVDRGFPDNRFVGTFTLQSMSRYVDQHKDTIEQFSNYSYWADERRAVITADVPHEKGITLYMVDLDHDVAVAAYNEGHSHVVPRLYIGTLAEVGVAEVMGGIEVSLAPTENFRDIAGKKCQLYRTMEFNHGALWIPDHDVPNPVLDMARWMEPRYINAKHEKRFQEVFMFGLKDHPMPFAIMGTYLTSFKPGKVPPPTMDLSNYRVLDERFRDFEKERREQERELQQQQRVITIDDWDDVAVPVEEAPPPQRMAERVPAVVEVPINASELYQEVPPGSPSELTPFLQSVVDRSANRFIGTATMEFSRNYHDNKETWTVSYAATADRAILISHSSAGLPSVRTVAYLIDRKAGTLERFTLLPDSTVKRDPLTLPRSYAYPAVPVLPDQITKRSVQVLERNCIVHEHRSTAFRRISFVDPKTASIYMDLFSALKGWDPVNDIIQGQSFSIASDEMPLKVDYFYGDFGHSTMQVLKLAPGAVDPKIFSVTKDSWK